MGSEVIGPLVYHNDMLELQGGGLASSCVVAHYKMNDNVANTTVIDSQGYSNGTAKRNTSVLHVAGKVGGALMFNGTSDYVNTNNSFNSIFQSDFSFEFWWNPTLSNADDMRMGASALTDWFEVCFEKIDSAQRLYGFYNIGGLGGEFNSYPTLVDGQWHHIVVVVKQIGAECYGYIYVNGTLAGSSHYTMNMSEFSCTTNFLIGAVTTKGGPAFFYKGIIDIVRIYNCALTADEIALLWNNGNGMEDLYYHLSLGEFESLHDPVTVGVAPLTLDGQQITFNYDSSTLALSGNNLKVKDNTYQLLDADLTAIAALEFTSISFLKKTAANTWALDTNTYYKSGDSPTFTNITDSGLTSGRIPYASTGGLLVDNDILRYDSAHKILTIGGTNVDFGTTTSGLFAWSDTVQPTNRFYCYSNTVTSSGYFQFNRARGTYAAKLKVLKDDILGRFLFGGYYDDGEGVTGFTSGAGIFGYADVDFTGSLTSPARLSFATGVSGALGYRFERLRILSTGETQFPYQSSVSVYGQMSIDSAGKWLFDSTGSIQIGSAASKLLGLWGATPVVQQAHIVNADGTLADLTTKYNALLLKLETIGLLAAA